MAHLLNKLGFEHFLIDGGGDLYAKGTQIGGHPWKIGIQHPRGDGLYAVLNIPSEWSVVSSGDYERFFVSQGQRFHHIIDLRTGYPAQGSIAVTVFAKNTLEADSWATALFILGPKEGLSLAEQTQDLEACIFSPRGNMVYTSGFSQFAHTLLPNRWKKP